MRAHRYPAPSSKSRLAPTRAWRVPAARKRCLYPEPPPHAKSAKPSVIPFDVYLLLCLSYFLIFVVRIVPSLAISYKKCCVLTNSGTGGLCEHATFLVRNRE